MPRHLATADVRTAAQLDPEGAEKSRKRALGLHHQTSSTNIWPLGGVNMVEKYGGENSNTVAGEGLFCPI